MVKNKWIYRLGLLLFPCFSAAAILQNTGILTMTSLMYPCLFHRLSGLYCPGCGGTRAVEALLQGHLVSCFLYHPFVLYCAVLYIWFMGTHTLERISSFLVQKKSPHKKPFVRGLDFKLEYVYLGILIILVQWMIKNIILLLQNC